MLPLGGVSINVNGGSFESGVKSDMRTILSILLAREEIQLNMDMSVEGGTASMAGVAEKARVCRNTAKKYCDMYDEDLAALSLYISSGGKRGPSANSSSPATTRSVWLSSYSCTRRTRLRPCCCTSKGSALRVFTSASRQYLRRFSPAG